MKLDGVDNWMDKQEIVNAVSIGADTVVGMSIIYIIDIRK